MAYERNTEAAINTTRELGIEKLSSESLTRIVKIELAESSSITSKVK